MFFAIFSFVLLVFIFLITIIQESNARQFAVFYEIADEAVDTNDFDEFVKYQSVAYRKLDQIESIDYTFHIYQVVAQKDAEYLNQFSIFVNPKREVSSANALNDLNDHTGIIITDQDTSEVIYQTAEDSSFTDYAVSFGIKKIGFYYYAIEIDDSYTLDITLKDYNAVNILSSTIEFDYISYNPDNPGTLLSLGYTSEEITALLDVGDYIRIALMENIAIFLVIDIGVGAIIYFILKKKILK